MVLSLTYLESFASERFKNETHYREGHIHILAPAPGTDIIGLHTPEMKKIAKEIARSGNWREILRQFASHQPLTGSGGLAHEERIIWGLVIDYVKCTLGERLSLIDCFLPCIDNWAICDTFCCNSVWAKKALCPVENGEQEHLWQYIIRLLHSNHEWSVRAGAILAMCHFLDEKHIDRTLAEIDAIGLHEAEPYYIRMGIAWLLATALAKNGDKTRSFVKQSALPSDIVRLYVRKARESFITRDIAAL